MADLQFALDIGTRSIVGLAFRYHPPDLVIENFSIFEHASRGMIDGQVQDIEEVARFAARVRDDLVKKTGEKFTRASIAFAGRSLHSRIITTSLEFPFEQYIDETTISEVNRRAINTGITHGLKLNMYCVGYVQVGYLLNDTPVRNPKGHYAHRLTARVLVTFLPREIVNSKIAVLRRIGLEPDIITLEPIAAGDIVFVERIRHLNLLLLDIGAGTTDLAITSGGTVVGYASLPFAGDEITEEISEAYLLDFETAEKTKRLLTLGEQVSFTSVFGKHYTVPTAEILARIEARVKQLAGEIRKAAADIFPSRISAVFCVGGGSFTPGIREALEKSFGIPIDRIIVPDARELPYVDDKTGALYGPHWMTPLGIARAAATRSGFSLLALQVNDQPLAAMGMGGKITVLEALGLRGLLPAGRKSAAAGKPLTFLLNETRVVIDPPAPRPSVLTVNGEPATMEAEVTNGATLVFEAGDESRDGASAAGELLDRENAFVTIVDDATGQERTWFFPLTINGAPAGTGTSILEGDKLTLPGEVTVETILRGLELNLDEFRQRELEVWVGDRAYPFLHKSASVRNPRGAELSLHDRIRKGERLTVHRHPELTAQVRDVLPFLLETLPGVRIELNGTPLALPARELEILMDGVRVTAETPLHPGAKLTVRPPDQQVYRMADLIGKLSPAAPDEMKGKRLRLERNGASASFDTPVSDGDRVEIRWE